MGRDIDDHMQDNDMAKDQNLGIVHSYKEQLL